ncbi:MAG TPA: phage Gp37/Gp68 family protein [Ktedonobacterales bacterium]|nr:phage Gp37/Gp68 family protein [Ktedonobacterales bacterium]
MSGKTGIAWTDASWNPIVGCTRVSKGCNHCYAFQLHDQRHIAWKRGRWDSAPAQYHQPFSRVQLLEDRLADPLHWRKPRRVFVNSMSDLFHPDVPGSYITRVWVTMRNAKQHTYQILTKRPERLLEWTQAQARMSGWPINDIWPDWIWLGVSVEDQAAADERIPLLLQTPAAVRFISTEPLLGPVNLRPWLFDWTTVNKWSDGTDAPRLDWVIIGGESGPHARPIVPQPVDMSDYLHTQLCIHALRDVKRQCEDAGVPVFMKQFGAVLAKRLGYRDRHGANTAEWSHTLMATLYKREWPTTAEEARV